MSEPGKIRVIRLGEQNQEAPPKPRRKPGIKKPWIKDTEATHAALAAKFAKLNKEDYAELAAAPRRRAREAALLLSFQMDMGGDDWELATQVLDDIGLNETGAAFALELAQNAAADRDRSDTYINKYAREWTLDRFAAIDRNILRLAVSELLKDKQDNANIIINEAIELAKKFGDENSGAFVNGILDAIRIHELSDTAPKERPE